MHEATQSDPIDRLPPIREVIGRFGLNARKSLGQHFLLDLNLTRRIAREAGDLAEGTVIEVGPGPGGLTRALLAEGAQHVVAIERDPRCADALSDLIAAAQGRLTLIEADATEVSLADLGPPPRRIVANLPYNVGTVLLVRWLREIEALSGMTLMFQKEVADRIVSGPGSKSYGRLSVMSGWLCDTRIRFNLPARAFTPPPKVASSVVALIPKKEPLPAEWDAMETVTAAAFGQRRKMLRRALRSLPVDAGQLLTESGLDPQARAEDLSVEQFVSLARSFANLRATL